MYSADVVSAERPSAGRWWVLCVAKAMLKVLDFEHKRPALPAALYVDRVWLGVNNLWESDNEIVWL
jgi:hypothetical protein